MLRASRKPLKKPTPPLPINGCPSSSGLQRGSFAGKMPIVKLLFENLPPSLAPQRETLARCLDAMKPVMPLRAVYFFGAHARRGPPPTSHRDISNRGQTGNWELE